MQNVERLSITLPAEMGRMIRAKVEEGRCASNSEVICEAMRAWQEQEQLRAQRLTKVRAKISEADARSRAAVVRRGSGAAPRGKTGTFARDARDREFMFSFVYPRTGEPG
jgi:antitoxin ParD1/3/4